MKPAPTIPTLTRSALTMSRTLRALATAQNAPLPLERDLDLAFLDRNGIGSYAHPGRGETLTGHDIEFNPVPRTGHDLALTDPGKFPSGRGGAGCGSVDRSFTERTILMRTNVGKRVERATDVEHADGNAPRLDDSMRSGRNVGNGSNKVLSHYCSLN